MKNLKFLFLSVAMATMVFTSCKDNNSPLTQRQEFAKNLEGEWKLISYVNFDGTTEIYKETPDDCNCERKIFFLNGKYHTYRSDDGTIHQTFTYTTGYDEVYKFNYYAINTYKYSLRDGY